MLAGSLTTSQCWTDDIFNESVDSYSFNNESRPNGARVCEKQLVYQSDQSWTIQTSWWEKHKQIIAILHND